MIHCVHEPSRNVDNRRMYRVSRDTWWWVETADPHKRVAMSKNNISEHTCITKRTQMSRLNWRYSGGVSVRMISMNTSHAKERSEYAQQYIHVQS